MMNMQGVLVASLLLLVVSTEGTSREDASTEERSMDAKILSRKCSVLDDILTKKLTCENGGLPNSQASTLYPILYGHTMVMNFSLSLSCSDDSNKLTAIFQVAMQGGSRDGNNNCILNGLLDHAYEGYTPPPNPITEGVKFKVKVPATAATSIDGPSCALADPEQTTRQEYTGSYVFTRSTSLPARVTCPSTLTLDIDGVNLHHTPKPCGILQFYYSYRPVHKPTSITVDGKSIVLDMPETKDYTDTKFNIKRSNEKDSNFKAGATAGCQYDHVSQFQGYFQGKSFNVSLSGIGKLKLPCKSIRDGALPTDKMYIHTFKAGKKAGFKGEPKQPCFQLALFVN